MSVSSLDFVGWHIGKTKQPDKSWISRINKLGLNCRDGRVSIAGQSLGEIRSCQFALDHADPRRSFWTPATAPLSPTGTHMKVLVDLERFELSTSSMPWKRAPNCATGPRGMLFIIVSRPPEASPRQAGRTEAARQDLLAIRSTLFWLIRCAPVSRRGRPGRGAAVQAAGLPYRIGRNGITFAAPEPSDSGGRAIARRLPADLRTRRASRAISDLWRRSIMNKPCPDWQAWISLMSFSVPCAARERDPISKAAITSCSSRLSARSSDNNFGRFIANPFWPGHPAFWPLLRTGLTEEHQGPEGKGMVPKTI